MLEWHMALEYLAKSHCSGGSARWWCSATVYKHNFCYICVGVFSRNLQKVSQGLLVYGSQRNLKLI